MRTSVFQRGPFRCSSRPDPVVGLARCTDARVVTLSANAGDWPNAVPGEPLPTVNTGAPARVRMPSGRSGRVGDGFAFTGAESVVMGDVTTLAGIKNGEGTLFCLADYTANAGLTFGPCSSTGTGTKAGIFAIVDDRGGASGDNAMRYGKAHAGVITADTSLNNVVPDGLVSLAWRIYNGGQSVDYFANGVQVDTATFVRASSGDDTEPPLCAGYPTALSDFLATVAGIWRVLVIERQLTDAQLAALDRYYRRGT